MSVAGLSQAASHNHRVAIDMARCGIRALPCWEVSEAGHKIKSPRNSGGHLKATLDEAQIAEWWTQWPNALVGIELASAGLFAIDPDRHGGPDGVAEWLAIAKLYGDVGPTKYPYVKTPSGGLHIYLKRPAGMEASNRTGGLPKGIDVRGAGYTIAPSCVMPDGRIYAPVEGSPVLSLNIAFAPDWLVNVIGSTSVPRDVHSSEPLVSWDGEIELSMARDLLETDEGAVEDSGGNKHTYDVACRLRALGISEATGFELMSGDWNEKCSPPWPMDELEVVVGNAYHYGQGCPGAQSPRHVFAGVNVPRSPSPKDRPIVGFPLLTIAELLTLPPVEWLVEGIIPKHGLAALYGAPGSMKSFIGVDLGLRVAFAMEWHGVVAKKVGVLYVAAEGAFGLRDRVKGWMEHHRLQGVDAPFLLLPVTVRMLEGSELKKLLTAIDEAAARGGFEIGLTIIDTVARAMAGADENAQSDMSKFVAAMDAVREHTQGAVLGIHHSGKDLARGMRGSSVLNAAVDTAIRAEIKGQAVAVTVEKQKDAPCGGVVYFTTSQVAWAEDDGVVQSTLVLSRGARSDTRELMLTAAQTDKAIQAISAAWNTDKPFSAEPRTKDRYLARWLSAEFRVDRQCAEASMRTWLSNGLINQEEHSRKNHRRGLRVVSLN